MAEKFSGKVEITNAANKTTMTLDADGGTIRIDNDKASTLDLWGSGAATPGIQLYSGGFIAAGGTPDGDGELRLYARGARTSFTSITNFRVHLSGDLGRLELRDPTGKLPIVSLRANEADMLIGGNTKDGAVVVRNAAGASAIRLDGKTGDITLQNADFAEDFDVTCAADAEPGTVMVLTPEETLAPSGTPYDSRVVGVVSGAGTYRPGLVLDRRTTEGHRAPLAMVGKVYCKVDASFGAIEVGDLMTTSPTPGHAMKASDPTRAFGAVLGKALRAHAEGRGLVPILVSLQ